MRDRGMGLWVELDDLPAAPQGVNAEVVGDRQQPRLEAIVRVESLQAVVGAQKRLLNKVLDRDLTASIGIYDASYQPLVGTQVSRERACNELFVVQLLAPDRQAPQPLPPATNGHRGCVLHTKTSIRFRPRKVSGEAPVAVHLSPVKVPDTHITPEVLISILDRPGSHGVVWPGRRESVRLRSCAI